MNVQTFISTKDTVNITKDGVLQLKYNIIFYAIKVTDLLGRSLENQHKKAAHLIIVSD